MKRQKDGRQERKCHTIREVDAGSSCHQQEFPKKKKERERENREENKSENLPKK